MFNEKVGVCSLILTIDILMINLDRRLPLVRVQHMIAGFRIDVMTTNCTVALAAELQPNDKLYDLIAKARSHLSLCGNHNFRARANLKNALTC